jgi:hypothetical protein
MPIDIRERIENDFTFHPFKGDQRERCKQLHEKAKELALLIAELTPTSREQSLALTHVEDAVMKATAAIVRNE